MLTLRIGADDDPQPERHPCPDFFDTCCILKSKEIIETAIKTPIGKPEKCGIRNKKGAGFNLIERDNEAQFGKQFNQFFFIDDNLFDAIEMTNM